MEKELNDVVIICNKKDYFLTKVCVASIRFFYDKVNIHLIKDFANGEFDTSEIENFFNVKIIDLGIRKYGWSGAKMHLLITKQLGSIKYLSLDSDIIFCGPILEYLSDVAVGNDIVISAIYIEGAYNGRVKDAYYDFNKIKELDKDFTYPGYVFNGGQMVITPGCLTVDETKDFFDLENYPRWKRLDIFPMVDQSFLNYLLPKKEEKGEIKICKSDFMLWSETKEVAELDITRIIEGEGYPFLIHWAGALRTPFLSKMTRGDILSFFEKNYYSKVPYGSIKRISSKVIPVCTFILRQYFKRLKRVLNK